MIGTAVMTTVLSILTRPGPNAIVPPDGSASTAACSRDASLSTPLPRQPNHSNGSSDAYGRFHLPVGVPATAKTVPPLSASVLSASQYSTPPPRPGVSS